MGLSGESGEGGAGVLVLSCLSLASDHAFVLNTGRGSGGF